MIGHAKKVNWFVQVWIRPSSLVWMLVSLQVVMMSELAHSFQENVGSEIVLEEIVEVIDSNGPEKIIVPSLVGKVKEGAIFSISSSGLIVGSIIEKSDDSIASGTVMAQTPLAGSGVDIDSPVDITVSSGASTVKSVLPGGTGGKTGAEESIHLKWMETPLGEVLSEVESSSGIKFKASAKTKEQSVTTEFYAQNWTDAIRRLLKGYSVMEVTNGQGELVKVLIMSDTPEDRLKTQSASKNGRKGYQNKTRRNNGTSSRVDPHNLSRMKKKLKLSRSVSQALYVKLKKIETWPKENVLPSSMYGDSELKDFLSLNGIERAEDLKDTSKLTRLKRAARKQMLIMKKRARASDIELE